MINYDADIRVPTWVAYRLSDFDLWLVRERTQCFRRDPRLADNADAAFCSDYKVPVFDRDGDSDPDGAAELMRANNGTERVAVPTHFYKILIHPRPIGVLETLTILLPHKDERVSDSESFLEDHIKSIDDIEDVTGIDFLASLGQQDPGKETAVEGHTVSELGKTE